jgi:hypothetical protein
MVIVDVDVSIYFKILLKRDWMNEPSRGAFFIIFRLV